MYVISNYISTVAATLSFDVGPYFNSYLNVGNSTNYQSVWKWLQNYFVGLMVCTAIPWWSHQSRAPKYNESEMRPWLWGTLPWYAARSVKSCTETTLKQPSKSSPFEPFETFVFYLGLLKRRRMHTIILPFSEVLGFQYWAWDAKWMNAVAGVTIDQLHSSAPSISS